MSTVDLLLAALPILVLIALLAFRVRPLTAVATTLALTLVLSFRFPVGAQDTVELGQRLSGVTASVVLIMYGGILLSEMLSASGAQDLISGWLTAAAGTPERAILLMGFTVTPLVESVIGWGVGVIVGVPLLRRAGLDATRAATIALLGLTLCPWGSLAPGLLVVREMSGTVFSELGFWIGLFNLPVFIVMSVAIALVGVGRRGLLRMLPEILVTVAVMWGVLLATNLWITPALAGIFSASAGICTLLACSRLRGPLPRMSRATRRAFSPYATLILAMLAVLTLAAIFDFGEWRGALTSPGLWLIVTAAVTPALVGLARADVGVVVLRGTRVWFPVCLVTVLFIAFGGLLSANGMGDTLADGAARLGAGFLLLMPAVGMLAGYLTGSNTSAAAMFSLGTTHASTALGASPLITLGSQTAAVGSAVMASPARVALSVGIADSLRTPDEPRTDQRRVMATVLLANLIVVAILTPLVPLAATLV